MNKIYDNILEIKDLFDIFIFDAYGVLYNGLDFFDHVKEVMEELIKENKKVCILSNSPQISSSVKEKYDKCGLGEKQYTELITSGEFCRNLLKNNKIQFKTNKNPKKYYVFGKQNNKLFEGLNYIQVNNINDADFIYLSALYFSDEEYNKMNNEDKKKVVAIKKDNGINPWRAMDIDILMPKIKKIIDSKKPVLNCNPDYRACEGLVDGSTAFVLTPGSVAKVLKENDVEVVEFGKPYREIYDFVFNVLKSKGINTDEKDRICMVGDTLRTDIKGANNAGIKSVLCLETGITANELDNGKSLDELIKNKGAKVDYIIRGVAVNID